MKKMKNLIVIITSFIAGIIFVVRCGGDVKTLANEFASAISFDNTGTSIDGTTTQEAITEISKTISYIYDANNKKVAIFNGYSDEKINAFDLSTRVSVSIEPVTGSVMGETKGSFVYTSSDCSGGAYYPLGYKDISISEKNPESSKDDNKIYASIAPIYYDGKIYFYQSTTNKISLENIHSFRSAYTDWLCTTWSATEPDSSTLTTSSIISTGDRLNAPLLFVEAYEVSIQPYTGPITIR